VHSRKLTTIFLKLSVMKLRVVLHLIWHIYILSLTLSIKSLNILLKQTFLLSLRVGGHLKSVAVGGGAALQ
jgi:cobalamin biosynthesis protein CobD/CbiB